MRTNCELTAGASRKQDLPHFSAAQINQAGQYTTLAAAASSQITGIGWQLFTLVAGSFGRIGLSSQLAAVFPEAICIKEDQQ